MATKDQIRIEELNAQATTLQTSLTSLLNTFTEFADALSPIIATSSDSTLNENLEEISDIVAVNDDLIQLKSGVWVNRTPTQVKADMSLDNVDNTSDATKNAASTTLTNKTISGASNTITGIKSGMLFLSNAVTAVADATTYYIGSIPTTPPNTTAGVRRVYIPIAMTIKAVNIFCFNTSAGSSENTNVYIRVNNTTDNQISSTFQMTGANTFVSQNVTGLSIAIAAGDFIEGKFTTPTFVTNPGNTYLHMTIYYE